MQNQALILIDVQQGFASPHFGKRNNPEAEENMEKLLAHCRATGMPIIHVRHSSREANSPLRPDAPGHAYQPFAHPQPGEKEFEKNVNSAFIGTGLQAYLHNRKIDHLHIIGLTTEHCVSTSVRMAANLGFKVTLIGDATAAFDKQSPEGQYFAAELVHEINLASLDGEFCEVVNTAKWLSQSGYPAAARYPRE
jgi:nicotinamidase-related amidase